MVRKPVPFFPDQNNPSQLPLERSRLMQLPLDPKTLAELPVDTSRLMRLPVDHSGLMRLPIDPDSEVEREFFGKKVVPEPEYIDDEPELAPPRIHWWRSAAIVVGLAIFAAGGAMAARSLRPAGPPLPAAAAVSVLPPAAPPAHPARVPAPSAPVPTPAVPAP
jgi:hypothetical protein